FFFFSCYCAHLDLHSFPTRRSSDLEELIGLRAAVAQLPERERQVMALCYFEELSMREIARVLRVTESRVCQIRQRAVQRLRERLDRKSTRLNSSHVAISYAVFCLKK